MPTGLPPVTLAQVNTPVQEKEQSANDDNSQVFPTSRDASTNRQSTWNEDIKRDLESHWGDGEPSPHELRYSHAGQTSPGLDSQVDEVFKENDELEDSKTFSNSSQSSNDGQASQGVTYRDSKMFKQNDEPKYPRSLSNSSQSYSDGKAILASNDDGIFEQNGEPEHQKTPNSSEVSYNMRTSPVLAAHSEKSDTEYDKKGQAGSINSTPTSSYCSETNSETDSLYDIQEVPIHEPESGALEDEGHLETVQGHLEEDEGHFEEDEGRHEKYEGRHEESEGHLGEEKGYLEHGRSEPKMAGELETPASNRSRIGSQSESEFTPTEKSGSQSR